MDKAAMEHPSTTPQGEEQPFPGTTAQVEDAGLDGTAIEDRAGTRN